jgi:phosphoribosylamine---glycine ligase
VLASRGYPGKYEKGIVIEGLETTHSEQAIVFHAGTARSPNGDFVTAGGRVLGVTAKGDTLAAALKRCYEAAGDISWEGIQYRRDIGRFTEVLSKTGSP